MNILLTSGVSRGMIWLSKIKKMQIVFNLLGFFEKKPPKKTGFYIKKIQNSENMKCKYTEGCPKVGAKISIYLTTKMFAVWDCKQLKISSQTFLCGSVNLYKGRKPSKELFIDIWSRKSKIKRTKNIHKACVQFISFLLQPISSKLASHENHHEYFPPQIHKNFPVTNTAGKS